MKAHKPIKLFCPTSVLNIINEIVKNKKENYIFIIHYILNKPTKNKDYSESDFIPINKKKVEAIIGCGPYRYIKFLVDNKIIESDGTYKVGEKGLYYRINETYLNDVNFYEVQPETILFKNIYKNIKNKRTNNCRLEPHLKIMYDKFMKMEYDFDAALKMINTITDYRKKMIYSISINNLSDKRFRYFNRNDTNNRLDTNITNLKRELRQFIKGNYVSIDLKNSQPFLLSNLINNISKIVEIFHSNQLDITHYNKNYIINNKHIPLCLKSDLIELTECFGIQSFRKVYKIRKKEKYSFFTNLSLFREWVSKGILYDEFIKKFTGINLSRDDVKEIMFEVLFSRNYNKKYKNVPYALGKKKFAEVFPIVYKVIKELKRKKHNNLAIYLQKLESKLFIDTIAKKLIEKNIIPFTIHDSIIIPLHQQEEALEIMKSVFKDEIGIIPKFHIIPLKKELDKKVLFPSNLWVNTKLEHYL